MRHIRRTWPIGVAVVATVFAGVLAAIGGWPDDTGVDPTLRDRVDVMESDRSCYSLQALFDQTNDADELRYIDDALRSAGCYD